MGDWVAWCGQVDFFESGAFKVGGAQKTGHIYAVTFVALKAKTKDPLDLAAADRRCGQFLFSHLWTFKEWTAYSGKKKLGRATVLDDAMVPDAGDQVAADIEKAVRKRVGKCANIFEYDEQAVVDLTGDASLVNASAGQVHWPAALSGSAVLKRTFLVGITEEVAGPNPNDIRVLPSITFQIAGNDQTWDMPDPLPDDHIAVLDVGTGADAIQLRIELRPGRDPGTMAKLPKLVATQSRATPMVVRSALSQSLNPLSMLRSAFEAARGAGLSITAKTFSPLRLSIQRMLGAGWGSPYTGAMGFWKTPYILHSIPGTRDVLDATKPPFLHRVDIGLEGMAELLGARQTDADFALIFANIETVERKQLIDPNTVADAWLRITQQLAPGDSYLARIPVWLAILGDRMVIDHPAKKQQWATIRSQLTSTNPIGLNRRAIAERNSVGTLAMLGRNALPQQGDVELKKFIALQKNIVRELEKGNNADAEKKQLKDLVFALMTDELKELFDSLDPMQNTTLKNALADTCSASVEDLAKGLAKELSLDRAVPNDEGLHLLFEADADEVRRPEDAQMRGYALALRAGILRSGIPHPDWDDSAKRWITDTAFSRSTDEDHLVTSATKALWMSEAVGSTIEQGERMVATVYYGHPLLSTPYKKPDPTAGKIVPEAGKEHDYDGFNDLEFLWPRWLGAEATMPPLAYGAAYQGVAATIGNAGEVRDVKFRAPGSYVCLKDADKCFDDVTLEITYYRSREKLPAPRVVVGLDSDAYAAYEMSEETRAAAYYARAAAGERRKNTDARDARPAKSPPKVTLLTHGKIWKPGCPTRATLRAYPPKASIDFIERWINADCLRAMLKLDSGYSHPDFNKDRIMEIQAFRDEMVEKLRKALNTRPTPQEDPSDSYHPAFGAYGVRIAFNGGMASDYHFALPQLSRDVISKKFIQKTQGLEMSIKPGTSNQFDEPKRQLTIKPGSFVQVTFFSLIDTAFVGNADSSGRFHPLPGDFTVFKDSWLACEGVDFYFEAAPELPNQHPLDGSALQITKPDDGQTEKIRVEIASTDRVPAEWIREFECIPHDFHWTGYPIELPEISGKDGKGLFEDWLIPHADTHSERRDLRSRVPVGTFFDGGDVAKWQLGAQDAALIGLMERAFHTELRPAHHTIYVVKPVMRFRKWLAPEMLSKAASTLREDFHLGASAVVPGIAPDLVKQRLGVPLVIGDFPLISTYQATGDATGPIANGSLLVIDEAIMRTDERAKFGGVGDTLEVDVLSSRGIAPEDTTSTPSWRQIGPNPIFEPAPTYTDPLKQPRLKMLPPSGLGYDISSNGLVTQTAVIVVPEEGHGQWLMAQVRMRRWIEPEVLLGTEVKNLEIPLRVDGEDIVPLDFAVACEPNVKALPFEVPDGFEVSLDFGRFTPNLKKPPDRFLVSWHKGRWDGGGPPTWRAQVLAQVRKPESMAWTNVAKSDCAVQKASWPKVSAIRKSVFLKDVKPKVLRLVPMSDYSSSRWLFFIGDFFAGSPIGAEKFALKANEKAHLTLEKRGATSLPKVIQISMDSDKVEFHWLLVYRPVRDLMRGRLDREAGVLLGAWQNTGATFERLKDEAADNVDLNGCHAYLCTFQRASALIEERLPGKKDVMDITSTKKLFKLMFTDEGDFTMDGPVAESVIRLVPKVLGPIPIEY